MQTKRLVKIGGGVALICLAIALLTGILIDRLGGHDAAEAPQVNLLSVGAEEAHVVPNADTVLAEINSIIARRKLPKRWRRLSPDDLCYKLKGHNTLCRCNTVSRHG